MIRFENTKVYNMYDAIEGMRNSWESWDKMDSSEFYKPIGATGLEHIVELGPNDLKLAMKLSKAGKAHDKFLRQIFVSVNIIAPEYWWKEADMYHFFETNSTSMMHTLGNKELTADMFSFDDPEGYFEIEYLNLINEVRKRWVEAGKIKHSRCSHWRKMNQLMAISYNYNRKFTSNYGQLKSMYYDRKNHRLSEWHQFAEWVETLPYSELITLKGAK